MQREFDVALSFAGEDREHAKQLADLLESGGYKCFYDEYNRAQLWGKNLLEHLETVYKDKAHFCVPFLSKHYEEKWWPRLELRSAAARAFKENREYILPVRLDDTEIKGILPTVMYLDLRELSIEEIYQDLKEKLSETLQIKPDKPAEHASELRPFSEESDVASLKRFLAEPRFRIQFADLIDKTVEHVVEVTSGNDFDANHPRPTTETVTARIRAYESACSTLIEMAMVGGRWAEEEHCEFWHRALQRFSMVPHHSGQVAWLDMQLYPGMLLLYALGISAVEADRLAFLGQLYSTEVYRGINERRTIVQAFAPYQRFEPGGPMKMLEGMENYHLPLNEWMINTLRNFAKEMIPDEGRYLYNFVKLEILMTLNSVYRPSPAWPGATRGVFLYNYEISWDVLQQITDSISNNREESPFVRADIFGQTSEVCMKHIDGLKQWISDTANQLGIPRWQVLQEQADRNRPYLAR